MERFILFVEEQSRYDNQPGVLLPSEEWKDGLCRVIVDYHGTGRVDLQEASRVRLDADRVAFLRGDAPHRHYDRLIGQATARLSGGSAGDARVWCIGEMSRVFARHLAEASGRDIALVRTSITTSVVLFHLPVSEITPEAVWPFFHNDYGARFFVFDREGTELEWRLENLERVMRRDGPLTDEDWRRGDWERTVRRALTDPGEVIVYEEEEGRPPHAKETVQLWQELQDDCWYRDRLAKLCADTRFCVLPDLKQDGTVSFHSTALPVGDVVEALCEAAADQDAVCSVIVYAPDGG
jgi:hypothetical protein